MARRLEGLYPAAECELTHSNAYELLSATILSAQCTDARVNMVTPSLFARYPTVDDLASADPSELEQIIRSTGFYQSKARNLIGMARRVVDAYGGEVPKELDDLVTLPRRDEERDRDGQHRHGGGQPENTLKRQVVAHRKDDQRSEDRRKGDGRDDPVRHHARVSCSSVWSSMSTLSWPDSSQAPKDITTITAVIPKEMTMAVSTSACGKGSA